MDLTKLSRWEVIWIIVCIAIFIFLSLLVIFKSEFLDELFYGDDYWPVEHFVEVQSEDFVEGYASFNLVSEEGVFLYLDLEREASITGIELALEKDVGLKIADFVCSDPFVCSFFDISETEVSILALIPPTAVELLPRGKLLVGEFVYSGFGKVYFSSPDAFVSTVDNPDFNILEVDDFEFLLD